LEQLARAAAVLIFLACYALAITRRIKLAYVGIGSAVLMICILVPLGIMTPGYVGASIKWDVLGIYWGFMMLSMAFSVSGVPEHLAEHVVRRTKNEGKALLSICAITAALSGFLENVGVLLIMAPIAIEIAKKAKSPLFTYLISIAISSNMVTTVSMVADPPAIILASETGMSFLDFYWFRGRIGLGIISAMGAAAGLAVLYFTVLRRMKKRIKIEERKIRMNYLPTLLFIGGITALAMNPYLGISPGIIGLCVGIIAIALDRKNLRRMIIGFDWNSFFFIIGVFVVIGAVVAVGALQEFANFLGGLSLGNPLISMLVLVWFSVAMSSFMDNVPYTVLMIPVCEGLARIMGANYLFPFLYGMIIGTGIGGNITPVGATATVFACGMLEKRGYRIRLGEYMKISVPMTISAVVVAQLLLHLFWM